MRRSVEAVQLPPPHGDVKLGCDHCGFVSFHDCSWNGGHCRETKQGAECAPPANGCSKSPGCTRTTVTLCVSGQDVSVDCTAVGLSGCVDEMALCACDGSTCECTRGVCTAPPNNAGAATSAKLHGDAGVPRGDAAVPRP